MSKDLFAPKSDHGVYNSIVHPPLWVAAALSVFSGVFSLFSIGLISVISYFMIVGPIITAAAFIFYKTLTHEAFGMDKAELRLYYQYNNLPADVRAKAPLTGEMIKRMGSDPDQWHKLQNHINNLVNVHKARMKEELRLDPETKSLFEGITQAIRDEEQYRAEIKKVLGDNEVRAIPQPPTPNRKTRSVLNDWGRKHGWH